MALIPVIKDFADDPKNFKDFIAGYGTAAPIIYILFQILQVVLAFIPGEFVEIAGGIAFGWFWGLIYSLIGVGIASAAVILMVRRFGRGVCEAFTGSEKLSKLSFLQDSGRLGFCVFMLFFIPGIPKDILTYFVALTPMKLSRYLIISSVARIPSVVTSTIAGEHMMNGNLGVTIAIFVVTGLLAAAGFMLRGKIEGWLKKISKK